MEQDERKVVNPNVREAPHPNVPDKECALCVSAKLISLNGGIVLAICLVLTAVTVASVMSQSFVASQSILFVVLTLASWIYLIDSVSEKLRLEGEDIVRTSVIGKHMTIDIRDIKSLLLRHEGLNQQVGIESLTVEYQDGNTERMPLGPCWRRRELEAFLASVEQAMGYEGVVTSER
jgi:hypothetical protein